MKFKKNLILAFSGAVIMIGALVTVLINTTAKNKEQDFSEQSSIVSKEDWESTNIGEYPIDVYSVEWQQLSHSEAETACNMPKEYAQGLTTEELVDYAVKYPFLMDVLAFDQLEYYMNCLAKKSSLFEELFSRSDCCDELLAEYLNMEFNDTVLAECENAGAWYTYYGSKVFMEAYIESNQDLLSEEQIEKFHAKRRK